MTQPAQHTPVAEQDPLQPHRDRMMYGMSLVAVVCLLPFSINDFIQGRYTLAVAILGVVVVLAIDAWCIGIGKAAPVPYPLLLLPAAAAITISLQLQGVIGAFWCYPLALFFHFVLPRRTANLCSVALLAGATVMVYRYIGMPGTVRFSVSL